MGVPEGGLHKIFFFLVLYIQVQRTGQQKVFFCVTFFYFRRRLKP